MGSVSGADLSHPSHQTEAAYHFRNLKSIDADAMAMDLKLLSSEYTNSLSVAELVDFYNQLLSSLLDVYTPITSRSVSFSHSAPWYTTELQKGGCACP